MRASVEIEAENPGQIIKSIEPDSEKTEKFSAKLSAAESCILLEVAAEDLAGLMAGINSNLKLIKVAQEIRKLQ